MIRLNNILLPTDFSRCARQAMDHAVFLAKQFDAELHVFNAIVLHQEDPHDATHHLQDVEEVHKRLKDLADKEMAANLDRHGDTDIKVHKVQERGVSAADVILDYAKDHDIDLVVMGTHGRRGLDHLFLGSVTEEVVHFAPCPVLTIREQKQAKNVQAMERILVPVDFSDHGKSALAYARETAAAYGSRLELLHVIEETVHPAFYTAGTTSILELRPDIVDRSKEAMKKLFAEVTGPEVEATFHTREGRAANEIVQYAREEEPDLIIIATHGLTGIEHLLIGSVTEKVVRQAPCPVFTVKSFGKSLIQ